MKEPGEGGRLWSQCDWADEGFHGWDMGQARGLRLTALFLQAARNFCDQSNLAAVWRASGGRKWEERHCLAFGLIAVGPHPAPDTLVHKPIRTGHSGHLVTPCVPSTLFWVE